MSRDAKDGKGVTPAKRSAAINQFQPSALVSGNLCRYLDDSVQVGQMSGAEDAAVAPNAGMYRLSGMRMRMATSELVRASAVVTVRKQKPTAQVAVDEKRYRARIGLTDRDPAVPVPSINVPHARGGPTDIVMGTCEEKMNCRTDMWRYRHRSCQGHFGMIDLVTPTPWPILATAFISTTSRMCPTCKNSTVSQAPGHREAILKEKPGDRLDRINAMYSGSRQRYCGENTDIDLLAAMNNPATTTTTAAATAPAARKRATKPSAKKSDATPPTPKNRSRTRNTDSPAPPATPKKSRGSDNDEDETPTAAKSSSSAAAVDDEASSSEEDDEKQDTFNEIQEILRPEDDDDDANAEDIADAMDDDNGGGGSDGDDTSAADDGAIEKDPDEDGAGGGGGDDVADDNDDDDDDDDDDGEGRKSKKRKPTKPKPSSAARGRGKGRRGRAAARAIGIEDLVLEAEKKSYEVDMNQFYQIPAGHPCSRLCKPYDPKRAMRVGCGAPIPLVDMNESGDISTRVYIPWEGNPSKTGIPVVNTVTLNQMYRDTHPEVNTLFGKVTDAFPECMTVDDADLGTSSSSSSSKTAATVAAADAAARALPGRRNPADGSELLPHPAMRPRSMIDAALSEPPNPIRGFMTTAWPVPPPANHPTKNEGSKVATKDIISASLSTMVRGQSRFDTKLWEDGVTSIRTQPDHPHPIVHHDLSKLGNPLQTVYWVKRPIPGSECTCDPRSDERCICAASGVLVKCTCAYADWCRCIISSLPEQSPIRAMAMSDPAKLCATPCTLTAVGPDPLFHSSSITEAPSSSNRKKLSEVLRAWRGVPSEPALFPRGTHRFVKHVDDPSSSSSSAGASRSTGAAAKEKSWAQLRSPVTAEQIIYTRGELKPQNSAIEVSTAPVYVAGAVPRNHHGSSSSGVAAEAVMVATSAARRKKNVSSWTSQSQAGTGKMQVMQSVLQKLVGKKGRYRGTGMKRVGWATRNVIISTIRGGMDQVDVPILAQAVLSTPRLIHPRSRAAIVDLIRAGRVNRLCNESNPDIMYNVRFLDQDVLVPGVRGDRQIAECQLENNENGNGGSGEGHTNRMPTLELGSMQGNSSRFVPRWVLGLPEETTGPYHADFDGDEMVKNIARSHLSVAESVYQMRSKLRLRAPEGAAAAIAFIENAVPAAYELTREDAFFTEDEFLWLVGHMTKAVHTYPCDVEPRSGNFTRLYDRGGKLPPPAMLFPEPRWHGRQVVSMLFPEGLHAAPKGWPKQFHMAGATTSSVTATDGKANKVSTTRNTLVIANGVMLCGRLDGSTLKPGSNSLVYTVMQDYGLATAKNWIAIFQLVLNLYLERWPLSIHRNNYMMNAQDTELRTRILAELQKTMDKPEHRNYNTELPNDTELFIQQAQARVVEIVHSRLIQSMNQRSENPDRISISNEGSVVPNHVLTLLCSGVKATAEHVVQMGGIRGNMDTNKRTRQRGNTSHYNRTSYDLQNHGWTGTGLADGCTNPMTLLYHLAIARDGGGALYELVPIIGYILRRMTAMLSGNQVCMDGTTRDPYGNIGQFAAHDDRTDCIHTERVDLKFFTPDEHADPHLIKLRAVLVRIWCEMYRHTQHGAVRGPALPVDLTRLLTVITSRFRHPNIIKTKKSSSLTEAAARKLVDAWMQDLVGTWRVDIDRNLVLHTFLLDMLSPWNLVSQWKLSVAELKAFLRELERFIVKSQVEPGESIGIIAAQTMCKPIMQAGLDLFKGRPGKAGSTARNAMEWSAANTSLPSHAKFNNCIKAPKRESAGEMTVILAPPYNLTMEAAQCAARAMARRQYADLLHDMRELAPRASYRETIESWPDAFARDQAVILHAPLVSGSSSVLLTNKEVEFQASVQSFPTYILRFRKSVLREANINVLSGIVASAHSTFKKGEYIMHSGELYDEKAADEKQDEMSIVYVHVNLAASTQIQKRIEKAQKTSRVNYFAVARATVDKWLQTYTDTCIPQVQFAFAAPVVWYEPTGDVKQPVVRREEWGLETRGSNTPVLPYLRRYVRYIGCKTTYVHDILNMHGIEGAAIGQLESLDRIIRPASNMDLRHLLIVRDTQTSHANGRVIPITGLGMTAIDTAVLRVVGFEKTIQNLERSTMYSYTDPLLSVASSSHVGGPLTTGVGATVVLPDPLAPVVPFFHPIELDPTASAEAKQLACIERLCGYNQRKAVPIDRGGWLFFQFFSSRPVLDPFRRPFTLLDGYLDPTHCDPPLSDTILSATITPSSKVAVDSSDELSALFTDMQIAATTTTTDNQDDEYDPEEKTSMAAIRMEEETADELLDIKAATSSNDLGDTDDWTMSSSSASSSSTIPREFGIPSHLEEIDGTPVSSAMASDSRPSVASYAYLGPPTSLANSVITAPAAAVTV